MADANRSAVMNPTFDARRRSQVFCLFPLLALSFMLAGGCMAAPPNDSRLEVRGDPRGTAEFRFREVDWRPARDVAGGVEMIGYGLIPFYNDPISRDWDPRYPRTGFVTLRLRATPQAGGGYAITLLGPSTSLGPGDDEVLSAGAENIQIENGDGDKRILRLMDVPIQSRNRPEMKLSLSGMIVATPTSADNFERQVRQFNEELGWRPSTVRPSAQETSSGQKP
jgi:hypothetical protein